MARTRNPKKNPVDSVSGPAEIENGAGPDTGGQSGDTQGLSDVSGADSESVKELVGEGQYLEADVIDGIENVPDADVAEVTTREVPDDDVPLEYLEKDQD